MRLLVRSADGAILAASNTNGWQVPSFAQIVDVLGDAETYAWPNGDPTRCLWSGSAIIANPACQDLAADNARIADIESNIASATIGSNPPITFAQAKAMTLAQWNTWWGNNVTNAAQAIGALKWVTLIEIRKLM